MYNAGFMLKYLTLTGIMAFTNLIAYVQTIQLDIDGAIHLNHEGEAAPDPGVIRWNGCDHEVWNGTKWVSLTNGMEFTPYVQAAGNSGDEFGTCIEVDHQGNLILGGNFTSDTLVFPNDTLFRDSNADIFLAKFKKNGQHLWSIHIEGDGDERLESIQVDDQGNIFLAGYFTGNSLVIQNLLIIGSNNLNLFFAKLDPNGNVIWLNGSQGNSRNIAVALFPDNESNLLLLGRFQNDDLVLNNDTVAHKGSVDVFIAKYDSLGQLLWVEGISGDGSEIPSSCGIDTFNNIYVSGYFNSDTLSYVDKQIVTHGQYDLFMVKLDKNGQSIWMNGFGGPGNDFSTDIAVGHYNELYVTGYFNSDTLKFEDVEVYNSGEIDFVLVKFNLDGTPQWAKNGICAGSDFAFSVDINNSNEVFIAGDFYNLNLSIGSTTLTNQGDADVFVAKFTSGGQFIEAMGIGDSLDERAQDLVIDELGYVFGIGYFNSNSISYRQETFQNQGGNDFFFIRYY